MTPASPFMEAFLLRAERRTWARALMDESTDRTDNHHDQYDDSTAWSEPVSTNAKLMRDGDLSSETASGEVIDEERSIYDAPVGEWTNDGLSDRGIAPTSDTTWSAAMSPPAGGVFNSFEFEVNRGRFWPCPVALLKDRTLKRLLGPTRARRSRGLAASVLPVLALLTWPGKANAESIAGSDSDWTPPVLVSCRYVARLSGIDKDSVRTAIAQLEGLGLARAHLVLHESGVSDRPRLAVQLSVRLFHAPGSSDRFVKFPAELIYGGAWSLIPTPAMRHLFLVLLCDQRIHDEQAFAASLTQEHHDPQRIRTEIMAARRKNVRTIRQLSRLSGLSESTVQLGIGALTRSLPGSSIDVPLLSSGGTWTGHSRWFAPNRDIMYQPFIAMNDQSPPDGGTHRHTVALY